MLGKAVLIGVAALAGVSIVIQQVLNATLRTALHSAVWSGFASYVVGTISMALLALALREPFPAAALSGGASWWAWGGGLFGAIYILIAILLLPELGAATFVALLIAGQMLASLAFDHFGWMGVVQRPADPSRLLGAALLVAGVVLIRR